VKYVRTAVFLCGKRKQREQYGGTARHGHLGDSNMGQAAMEGDKDLA
jgi:hypothetical protein